jgi:hypothetical protein
MPIFAIESDGEYLKGNREKQGQEQERKFFYPTKYNRII